MKQTYYKTVKEAEAARSVFDESLETKTFSSKVAFDEYILFRRYNLTSLLGRKESNQSESRSTIHRIGVLESNQTHKLFYAFFQ